MSPVTYDPASLLPNLRNYLVNSGLVRLPSTPGTQSVPLYPGTPGPPPMWLDPLQGTPYPGQTEGVGDNGMHPTMVVAVYPETGIPSRPFEGFYEQRAATIYFRALRSPDIQRMHEQVRALLHDQRNYLLADLQVNQSMMTRELQRIGADEEGYIYNTEYLFDLWGPD